jgi:predicted DNA repair protein MutK
VSGGLVALLDDIATLAKVAAASIDDVGAAAGRAGAKAAGVVVDDTAVTPRYVHNFAAERELPMIKRIALGSLRNKLLFILPAALVLSEYLPWLLTPLLMLGGTYLCYEGVEKIWEKLGGGHHEGHGEREPTPAKAQEDDTHPAPAGIHGPEQEEKMVGGAIRTDFILSAEIMVIALNEVTDEPFLSRALILLVVAIGITILVYGVVGLIVKMDDIGLRLVEEGSDMAQTVGRGLVMGMPRFMAILSTVGVVAMLWVGGHILLVGLDELGWHWLYDQVHHLEESVSEALGSVGGVAAWLVNTTASAVLGLVVGAVVVAGLHQVPGKSPAPAH